MSSIAISASRQAANGPARLNPNDEEGPVSREDLAKFAFAWREVKCVPEISIAKVSALSSFDPDDCEFVDDPYVLKDVYEHIAAIILLHGGRYAMDLLAPLYWPGGTYIPALISDFFCVRFSDLETGTDVDVEKIILSGGIDREAIRRYLLQLVISHDLANDAVKSLLFEVLLALFMSRKLQSLLMALIANGPASPVGTLSPFRDRPIGALQYAQQTFLAACNPIRQDHCACLCFAASFAIALQWNSPKRMFKVIAELLLRGWLSVPVPGEDSSSERIAANVFEGPPAEGEVSYAFALQLMLVRTLADGSKVNAFSAEDTSDFRTSIARGDIQKFLALTGEINDQLTALGLTELKLVCGKYPRYDSFSENTSSGRSGRRGRGLWFFPIGHSLEELVPPRIFFPNYIARLQKMAEENCGLSAVISKAVELSRLPMLDHSQGGGAAADIISLMPKVKFPGLFHAEVPMGDAVACLSAALNAMIRNFSKENRRRAIVIGAEHLYTLTMDLSPAIRAEFATLPARCGGAECLRNAVRADWVYQSEYQSYLDDSLPSRESSRNFIKSILDPILRKILQLTEESEEPVLFFDPNWRDSVGTGIRCLPREAGASEEKVYQLCTKRTDGTIEPADYSCFFKKLAFLY